MVDNHWGAQPEHAFLAITEETEDAAMTCTEARIRDIDERGCYVNTPNTFPENTPLTVLVYTDDETSVVKGRIVYVHDHIGMAIAFENSDGRR